MYNVPSFLTSRVRPICNNRNLDFNMSYMGYSELNKWKKSKFHSNNTDGVVDSIRHVLKLRNADNLYLLRLLLKAF